MAYLGIADIDPDEAPFEDWEVTRATKWLEGWSFARRKYGEPAAGACPHETDFCGKREQCIERIAWWHRYIREIEGI